MKSLFIYVVSILTMVSLSSCGNNLTEMEASELRTRAYNCVVESSTTAAESQVCANIKRECLRRQKAGQFDC